MPTTFTPLASFSGGLMIGLAAVLLMALHGRIFGVTGLVRGMLRLDDPADWRLRTAVILGMVAAPVAMLAASGVLPQVRVPVSVTALIVGGFIVGLGVTWGNGCTSGHGVCGNARLSARSIVATVAFMAAAVATVFVTRHLIGA